jgi:NAD(P)-dependent dehydrogenase (short-subunit alcohol dehydrogenase family)
MSRWSTADLPDCTGRTVLITGANSGLGYEAALALAGKGARVLLACRDQGKGAAALAQIRAAHPNAQVELVALDLASLADIRRCAAEVASKYPRIDVLMNNAGVMALPQRATADGFEMQIGTNHLGHFALTGLLLAPLLAAPAARVVTLSSGAHRMGRMRFDDLNSSTGYRPWGAYGQSKLANLLFAYELQRRLAAAGAKAISVAAHPGYAATNLQAAGPRMEGSSFKERIMEIGNALFSQSAAMGALPQLYAATAPDVQGGAYYGPDSIGELWGHPRVVQSNQASQDRAAAQRLWELSEQLTGVRYALG